MEKVKLPKAVVEILDKAKEISGEDKARLMAIVLQRNETYELAYNNIIKLAAAIEFGYEEEKEIDIEKRNRAFKKFNREIDEFRPYDIGITKEGKRVHVETGTDKQGEVTVLFGNEEDGYLLMTIKADDLMPRYFVEQRLDIDQEEYEL